MDPVTFKFEFTRLYRPLAMYALRATESIPDAEDVVQEAFVKAWKMIGEGYEIDSFKALMYRLVRNGAVDLLRSRREHLDIDLAADVSAEEIDTSERDAALWEAVDRLPAKCRQVFLMSKRDGIPQAEIADELGISLKTVKNQLTKAYSRLRDDLPYIISIIIFIP